MCSSEDIPPVIWGKKVPLQFRTLFFLLVAGSARLTFEGYELRGVRLKYVVLIL